MTKLAIPDNLTGIANFCYCYVMRSEGFDVAQKQLAINRCAFCGDFVPSGRVDRQYCSNSCKQKCYRWRIKSKRYASDARKNLANLATYLDYPDARASALSELKDCQEFIRQLMSVHHIKKVS